MLKGKSKYIAVFMCAIVLAAVYSAIAFHVDTAKLVTVCKYNKIVGKRLSEKIKTSQKKITEYRLKQMVPEFLEADKEITIKRYQNSNLKLSEKSTADLLCIILNDMGVEIDEETTPLLTYSEVNLEYIKDTYSVRGLGNIEIKTNSMLIYLTDKFEVTCGEYHARFSALIEDCEILQIYKMED